MVTRGVVKEISLIWAGGKTEIGKVKRRKLEVFGTVKRTVKSRKLEIGIGKRRGEETRS